MPLIRGELDCEGVCIHEDVGSPPMTMRRLQMKTDQVVYIIHGRCWWLIFELKMD